VPCSQWEAPLNAVVFDLDDTLYPELEFVRSGFRAVAHYLERRFGRSEKQIVRVLQSVFDGGERQLVFNEALKRMGLPHDDGLVEDLVSVYRNHEPAINPFPGVRGLLKTLRKDFSIAMLTDGCSERQLQKVKALGIKHYFERIVCTEDRGEDWLKPAPLGFQELQQSFGLAGDRCAYIADNPLKDFLAPNRMGWLTVRVRSRQGLYRSLEGSGEYKARLEVGQIVRLILILKE
jgi:putative hydrolase of the HAD superfamily